MSEESKGWKHNFELDKKHFDYAAANMKFTKTRQLKITYYTILVYFGITLAKIQFPNLADYQNFLFPFFILLFIFYTFIHLNCWKDLKKNRNKQNEIEKYYNYRNYKKLKDKRGPNDIRGMIFLFFYLLIGGLGAGLSIYALGFKGICLILSELTLVISFILGIILYYSGKKRSKKEKFDFKLFKCEPKVVELVIIVIIVVFIIWFIVWNLGKSNIFGIYPPSMVGTI